MKLLFLFLAPLCMIFAQSQSSGAAATNGACSPANTGNSNTFTMTCGIGKEQGEKMLRIMNQIFEKQLDLELVMVKMQEMAKARLYGEQFVAPGATGYQANGPGAHAGPTIIQKGMGTVFERNGFMHTQSIGRTLASDEATPAFSRFEALYQAQKWSDLVAYCQLMMQSYPEWITPYEFAGYAYANSGEGGQAKAMLNEALRRLDSSNPYAAQYNHLPSVLAQIEKDFPN
jgi:hypothetical protein